jgi:DNA-binding NtrC family response regulator
LLYHQFKAILEINRSNRSLLVSLSHSVRSVVQENHLVKEQLQQVRMSYGESIVNLAQQQLQEISARYCKAYTLSVEALEKIRDFRGNLRHLPAILENAVVFSENLLGDDGGGGVIQGYCLDFDSYEVSRHDESYTRRIDSRTSRSMQLLDRLEKASLSLKSRSQPLTSANVGRELDPPVTAPAITDALSKNKEIIRQLLEKYPERWENIRSEFRPLLNQVKKSAASDFLEERA